MSTACELERGDPMLGIRPKQWCQLEDDRVWMACPCGAKDFVMRVENSVFAFSCPADRCPHTDVQVTLLGYEAPEGEAPSSPTVPPAASPHLPRVKR